MTQNIFSLDDYYLNQFLSIKLPTDTLNDFLRTKCDRIAILSDIGSDTEEFLTYGNYVVPNWPGFWKPLYLELKSIRESHDIGSTLS